MKTKINFILDSIIQILVLTCTILLVLTRPDIVSILFLIIIVLFGIRDIEDVGQHFYEAFINKKE